MKKKDANCRGLGAGLTLWLTSVSIREKAEKIGNINACVPKCDQGEPCSPAELRTK